jgi:hypothetical protein
LKTFLKILLIISLFNIATHAYSLTSLKYAAKLIKSSKALAPKQIKKLAKLLDELHGTKKVGKALGKMKLPNEVLEDTFMRLAIYTKKINRKEAEEMMQHLKDVPGFRTTLRKIIGKSAKKTTGHLHELRLAKKASKNGFKVAGIGEKFSDGIKSMPSDIDLLLKKKNKLFAIEAKSYLPSTNMKPSMIKADMKTLSSYAKQNRSKNVIPVFSITNKPASKVTQKILEKEAKRNGVQLLYGNPQEQMEQIKLLSKIL